jgi:hypothetical protein
MRNGRIRKFVVSIIEVDRFDHNLAADFLVDGPVAAHNSHAEAESGDKERRCHRGAHNVSFYELDMAPPAAHLPAIPRAPTRAPK